MPAHQLRLGLETEDGEAETDRCRAACYRWRTASEPAGLFWAVLMEPPYADLHVRWCRREGRVTAPPMPIFTPLLAYLCCRSCKGAVSFRHLRASKSAAEWQQLSLGDGIPDLRFYLLTSPETPVTLRAMDVLHARGRHSEAIPPDSSAHNCDRDTGERAPLSACSHLPRRMNPDHR